MCSEQFIPTVTTELNKFLQAKFFKINVWTT